MKGTIVVWTAVAALMLPGLLVADSGATADIQVDPQGPHAKKYVAFGWEYAYMLPEYFISHVAEFEKTALDGIGFNINGDKAAGRRYQCFREIMQAPRWTKESLANLVAPCRKMTSLKPFRESFVRSMVQPLKRIDWRDDAAWDIVSNNLRTVAWFAREAGFRGVFTDIEDYPRQRQFFRVPGDPGFDQLTAIVRRRAADIWRGVFEEYPDVTVFCFWLLSDAPYRHVETELPAFMRERGDLWPAFVNGMLDVLPSTATLVDGEEDAYKFEAARHDFFKARTRMRSWDLPLVAPENRVKYLSQVSQSFGQYLDMYVNKPDASWYFGPVDGSRLRHFAQNLAEATSAADKYVWFWSERGSWIHWCEKLRNDPERLHRHAAGVWDERIAGGLNDMMRETKDPATYLVPRLEKAMATGELPDLLAGEPLMGWKRKPSERDVKDGWTEGTLRRENGELVGRGVMDGCFHRAFPGVRPGDVYYVKGRVKGSFAAATISWKSRGRGIYSTKKLLVPITEVDADGWRKIAALVRVPETADYMQLSLGFSRMPADAEARYRDFRLCRVPPVGEAAFTGDFSSLTGWRVHNFRDRLSVSAKVVQGERCICLSRTSAPKKGEEGTAWALVSSPFPVTPGRGLAVAARVITPAQAFGGRMSDEFSTGVRWLDAEGRECAPFSYFGFPGKERFWRTSVRRVKVPEGAAKAEISIGFATPNLTNGEFVAVSALKARLSAVDGTFDNDPEMEPTQAPEIALLTPSPFEDAKSPVRFRLKSRYPVKPTSLAWRFDGHEATELVQREGDGFMIRPPKGAWEKPSFHRIEVEGEDEGGNRFVDHQLFVCGARKNGGVAATLRDDGFVLVDGKPFFPIGFYGCVVTMNGEPPDYETALKDLKSAGCNIAQIYPSKAGIEGAKSIDAFLDIADKHGMKTFVRPGVVRGACDFAEIVYGRRRHHPCALAWMLGDDTASWQTVSQVRSNNKCLKAVDPDRLTAQTDSEIFHNKDIHRYLPFVGTTDVFQPQIYPVEAGTNTGMCVSETIQMMKAYAEDIEESGRPQVSVWPIIQAFYDGKLWKRYPTMAEHRAIAYLSVIHGAQGLLWYTYRPRASTASTLLGASADPEHWQGLKRIIGEIASIQNDLAARNAKEQPTVQVLEGAAVDARGYDSISCLLKDKEGGNLLLVANSSVSEVKARIGVKGFAKATTLFETPRVLSAKDGLVDTFGPLEVHVYRLD